MSEKLCKKCGCVVFEQNSEYCNACMPKAITTNNKKDLIVNSKSSDNLSTLDGILMFIAFIMMIIGIIMTIAGVDDLDGYYSDPTIFIVGIMLFISGVSYFITRPFIKALITITKCTEYYNAQIEDKFNIK